jgi:hypothetical protein
MYTHASLYVRSGVYHTYVNMYLYTYIRTHIHTHVYTSRCVPMATSYLVSGSEESPFGVKKRACAITIYISRESCAKYDVCICVCVYVCIHVCVCVNVCMYVCMYVCVCTYVAVYMLCTYNVCLLKVEMNVCVCIMHTTIVTCKASLMYLHMHTHIQPTHA